MYISESGSTGSKKQKKLRNYTDNKHKSKKDVKQAAELKWEIMTGADEM